MLGKAREELVEIAAGELPGERLGHLLVASLEGDEAFGQSIEVGEVIWSEKLALNHREVDLDLVEPGSVSRKMDESQVGPLPLQTLHRGISSVGGTIVHHPEDPTRRGVGFLLHHLLDEAAKRLDADLRLATPEEPGAMDVPGGQVGQGSLASVLVFDAHLPIFARWKGRMTATPGLDGGFLVGADHEFICSERHTFPPPFVKVQNPSGFLGEVGVPGEDPRAMVKGSNGVLGEPSPDGGARDLGHYASLYHLPSHLLGTPATQRYPAAVRKLTSYGLHLHSHRRGKRLGAYLSEVDLPARPDSLHRTACATSKPPARWCPAEQRSPSWGSLLRPTGRSWRRPLPSRVPCGGGIVSGGWCAHRRRVRCGKDSGWASRSPFSTPRYLPRTLSHRGAENASMKLSQGPLRC